MERHGNTEEKIFIHSLAATLRKTVFQSSFSFFPFFLVPALWSSGILSFFQIPLFRRSNFVPFSILSYPEHKVLSSAGYRSLFTTLHVRLCRRIAFGQTKLWSSFCYGLDISILHWIRSFMLSTTGTFESPSTDLHSGPATGINRTTSSSKAQSKQRIVLGGNEQEIYYAKNIFVGSCPFEHTNHRRLLSWTGHTFKAEKYH